MANDTKTRILNAALDLFSENGYAGTNIQSIADSVGIVKSALYRHFDSKEAIRNALLDRESQYYNEHFGSADKLPPIPKTADEFKNLSSEMVKFSVYDNRIVKVRKLLTLEQYREEKTRDLATAHFLTYTKEMFTVIFGKMMKNGIIKQGNAEMLAFLFTAPITSLIQWHDREPSRDKEIMETVENFIEHFISTYTKK